MLDTKVQGNLGANYLLPLIPIGMIETVTLTFPQTPLLSHTIGVFTLEGVVALVLLTCAAVLWLRFVPRQTWPRTALVMLWSLTLLWLITSFASFYHGQYWYWSQASVALPIALMMFISKRPPRQFVVKALDLLAFFIIIIFSIRLVTDIQLQTNLWSNWIDFNTALDREFRWYGLAGNPNVGAPLGAFLVLYALVRRGKLRYFFLIPGFMILLITLSRSVIFSLLVALAVMGIFSRREWLRKLSMGQRWTVGSILVLAFALPVFLSVLSDPTVNLRTPVWAHHWGLLTSNLPTTLTSGFGETNAAWLGADSGWFGASEPHNVVLSVTVRYGIFSTVAVLVVAATAFFVALDSARRGRMFGIGLWIFIVLLSLTEDQIDWRYLDFIMMLLIFIPLSAADPRSVEAAPSSAKIESVS